MRSWDTIKNKQKQIKPNIGSYDYNQTENIQIIASNKP